MIRTCIICPKGCELLISGDSPAHFQVEGNLCDRGKIFAKEETFSPKRSVQSTVKTKVGLENRVSVKTSGPVPKEKMMQVMAVIKELEIKVPMDIGSVLVFNVLNLGVDIVLTSNVEK